MTELKRCPFCGGEARLWHPKDYGITLGSVKCNSCGASTESFTDDDSAIEAWNKRSNWHTGTPTKEDWYFVMWKDTDDNWTRFSALLWNNGNKTWYDDVTPETNWGDEYHAEVIAWMPIPPFKGEKE